MWTHSGVSYAPQPNENEKYYKKKKDTVEDDSVVGG